MNQVNEKNNPRLNNTWHQIFSKVLQPPITTHKNTTIQFPTREHTTLLKPVINKQIGIPMTEVHTSLRISSVNANTLLLRSALAELHKLCLQKNTTYP